MNKYRITVIIPVKNGAPKIERCLETVYSQSLKPYEVIIVDGNSTDDTLQKAKKFPVTILYENYHTRSGACQTGIEHATGEYIAFTDADCYPDTEWLTTLVNTLDDSIAGVGGAIKNLGDNFWIHSVNLAYGTFLGSANSIQGGAIKGKGFVNSISGCNSLYRKRDLLKVGGFKHTLPGAEDADLNSRMLTVGKLLFVPSAIVFHDHGRGFKDFAKQMLRYGRDRGVARKLSLAVIPSILLLLLLISLFFTPWFFSAGVAVYLFLIFSMGLKFTLKENNLKYMGAIPLIYVVEHSLYSIGFWKGLILRR